MYFIFLSLFWRLNIYFELEKKNIERKKKQIILENYSNKTMSDDQAAVTPKKPPKRPPILPNDIKCVLLQGYGSIKQLKSISIPRPKPGDGEVLVHVKSW